MNGYLHRIRLKPSLDVEQLARALPSHAYAEHQLVWRWFAGEVPGRDFLFRREEQGHWPYFYVLSQREAAVSEPWEVETRTFAPKLLAGDRLSFVLRANPVVVRKISDDPEVKTRRRDDLVADLKKRRYPDKARRPPLGEILCEAGAEWLLARAARNGFALESVRADGYRQHRWHKRGSEQPITLSTLEFAGTLKVEDPALFTEKLFHGLGPAKSFGCGLLLVRRAS
jgi:CRISPR system Cascade subunit CasE